MYNDLPLRNLSQCHIWSDIHNVFEILNYDLWTWQERKESSWRLSICTITQIYINTNYFTEINTQIKKEKSQFLGMQIAPIDIVSMKVYI